MIFSANGVRIVTLVLTASVLSACQDGFQIPSLGLRTPTETLPAINRPQPDQRGVITYETYQVIVARSGDSLGTMAGRIGLTANDLARHNGLPASYTPRVGEVLALPGNVGGSVVTGPTGWSPAIAETAINNATGGIGGATPSVGRPDEPIRHRVEAGDTAYSIARLYNVSVTALSSWNGLGADLGVRIGQELIIPVPDTARIATNTATTTVAITPTPTPTAPTTTATASGFLKPVDGPVARPYNPRAGSSKNDGIDYSAPAGTGVRVAADGTVALVSKSTGGLGTIVLVRHAGGILTIYGRVDNVTVAKGTKVTRGQTIGVVAAGDNPTVHFEVRKGSESVDPAPYMQ